MSLVVPCSLAVEPLSFQSKYNDKLLPSPFPVYVIENSGVINHPAPGAEKKLLPTDNSYTGSPGCYLACYSHNPGIYKVSESISVMGQIRVPGEYIARNCHPTGYQWRDISGMKKFKNLCADKIPACRPDACWAGGDTGGWFGIQ
ncbi:hypothetical protein [Legionella spiritensis]